MTIIVNDDLRSGFIQTMGAAVTLLPETKSKPSAPLVEKIGTDEIMPWGDANDFPQVVLEAARKTIIPTGIDFQVRALYGKLRYGIEEIVDVNGKAELKRTPIIDENVEAWRAQNNLNRYLLEAGSDFYWFGNFFPELIVSNDRKAITNINAQEAAFARLQVHNKEGLSEHCYLNTRWNLGAKATDKDTVKVRCIDPYYDRLGFIANSKESKFIYPSSFPSPNSPYYQVVPWDSIRKNGWLDIYASIPKWKKALMQNQLSIKYHIEIPDYYWSWKYPDWEKKSTDDRKKIIADELKVFNDMMQGADNAGKAIITQSKFDAIAGKEYPGWKINTIDDKLKDGTYIEDSQEAFAQLLFALGIDGTLIGNGPGKNMGAGSGSDKRVAFNIYRELRRADVDIILEPLNLISDYHFYTKFWDKKIVWWIEHSEIATLDTGKETKTTSA